MSRYIDAEPYDDYFVVASYEDDGIMMSDIPTEDVQEGERK